ncbi:MAG: hypothetical protein WEB09_08220 [Nitriliruptor sp.]
MPVGAALPPRTDALLGRFHPAVAGRLGELLYRRGIEHRVVTRDDDTELYVDAAHQGDLRAEFALTWAQIVHGLPADDAVAVLGLGGATPGWYDAPEGGWVDRAGRFVVDAGDGEGARMAGPAIAAAGAVILLLGWYAGAGAGVLIGGAALLLLGALIPR